MVRSRYFLFLQGPHGPFFFQLAHMLRQSGARIARVGFNAGDRVFWPERHSYTAFNAPQGEWSARFQDLIARKGITDLVLYGDTRPIHVQALKIARDAGLRTHIFEEGYLRPYWVSYEREGANGHSALMQMSIAQMARRRREMDELMPRPPALWGDMREHMLYGALYHAIVMIGTPAYRHFKPHREQPITTETRHYARKLLRLPLHIVQRRRITRAILRRPNPYHLALLQLDHDENFRRHSPFEDSPSFLKAIIAGFASGAPSHHHLVVKAHPLETGRKPLQRITRDLAHAAGIADRVHYVPGGKLAPLLTEARSAVTVNSTAGQQVLLHGIPLKAFGAAVYDKPELVSDQPLPDFFADPRPPLADAYATYRHFLMATSQLPGGFYARRSRRQLLRRAADAMLQNANPYTGIDASDDRVLHASNR